MARLTVVYWRKKLVYVRYLHHGVPTTQFAGIKNPEKGNAKGILKVIDEVLASLKLTENETDEQYMGDIYKKIVNANFDGASVMSGSKTGVQTRMKEVQPGMVYTHCTAHRLELAVLDSIKFDDYLEIFDSNINNIFKFYYYSPTRRKKLNDLALLLEEEFRQLGRLKQIRWLASRSRALQLLELNYKVLVFDLESKSYGDGDTAKKALGYVNFLKTPKFLFYVHFLQDLVDKLRPLSLEFQKSELLACHVPRKLEETKAVIDAMCDTPGEALVRLINGMGTDENGDNSVQRSHT